MVPIMWKMCYARSETTGGSVMNCQNLGEGILDMGMAMSIEELLGVHNVASFFQIDIASETVIPMHPCAQRFFGQ